MSPLFAAIAGKSKNISKTCQCLVRRNADLNEIDEPTGSNALHQAVEYFRYDLVDYLLEGGAESLPDIRGFTPLAKAVYPAAHIDTVNKLLDSKASPNTQSKNGSTPLSTACKMGYLEIATLLVTAGAVVDAESYYQSMVQAGHRVVLSQDNTEHAQRMKTKWKELGPPNDAIFRMLTQHGGSVTTQNDSDGDIPLHLAACDHNVAAANHLIAEHQKRHDKLDQSIDGRDMNGMTPLMMCSRHGALNVAKRLVECKADVHARDKDGNTALHHTWWETMGRVIHNSKMFDYLTETCGADKEAVNKDGLKPELPPDGRCVVM